MTIEDEIHLRKINEVLHFTTHKGTIGILSCNELLSRHRLPEHKHLQYVLHVNSAVRPEEAAYFDKSQNWLDYVNLSISEINKRFYEVSRGWHVESEVWWCILSFDPIIMTHQNVMFATTNNGYPFCKRNEGLEGFTALFAPEVTRKTKTWIATRLGRNLHNPTCEQAEVLYPQSVPLDYLRRIYIADESFYDLVRGWLHEFGFSRVEVVISPEKFNGNPN